MAETETEQIPQTEEPDPTPEQEPTMEEQEPTTEQPEQPANEENTETADEELTPVRDPILDEDEMKKLFVGGISPKSTDEELKTFFEEISGGKVVDHVIIRKDTDKKSHFGFITFETSELVDEVLLKRDLLKFCEKQLDVNRAVPKNNTSAGAHDKTKKLFIANLPKLNCTEDDLKKYFERRHPKKYGIIESIQLIKKKDEQGNKLEENKGFGFILVSSEDMADKMAIQHATFEYGGRKIELKKSVPTTQGERRPRGGRGGGGNVQYNPGNYYNYGYYPSGGYENYPPYAGNYNYDAYNYGPPGGGQRSQRGRFRPY